MSHPFGTQLSFDGLVHRFRHTVIKFPDKRRGGNTVYTMEDAALGDFSVFFTQSPSFLDCQRTMGVNYGQSNANTLFDMSLIPCDNQIHNLLDPVPPSTVFLMFSYVVDSLNNLDYLAPYRYLNGDLLIAMDGARFFSSNCIHCDHCNETHHGDDGTTTYHHSAITPVIVAPGNPRVIPLEPEFISKQDGNSKQDRENVAAKRWLAQ